ncbi:Octapeptide-repeat protein T2, partial [Ophiophagus hannah]
MTHRLFLPELHGSGVSFGVGATDPMGSKEPLYPMWGKGAPDVKNALRRDAFVGRLLLSLGVCASVCLCVCVCVFARRRPGARAILGTKDHDGVHHLCTPRRSVYGACRFFISREHFKASLGVSVFVSGFGQLYLKEFSIIKRDSKERLPACLFANGHSRERNHGEVYCVLKKKEGSKERKSEGRKGKGEIDKKEGKGEIEKEGRSMDVTEGVRGGWMGRKEGRMEGRKSRCEREEGKKAGGRKGRIKQREEGREGRKEKDGRRRGKGRTKGKEEKKGGREVKKGREGERGRKEGWKSRRGREGRKEGRKER